MPACAILGYGADIGFGEWSPWGPRMCRAVHLQSGGGLRAALPRRVFVGDGNPAALAAYGRLMMIMQRATKLRQPCWQLQCTCAAAERTGIIELVDRIPAGRS